MLVPQTGKAPSAHCGPYRQKPTRADDRAPKIWQLEFIKGNYGPRPEPLRLELGHQRRRPQMADTQHKPRAHPIQEYELDC